MNRRVDFGSMAERQTEMWLAAEKAEARANGKGPDTARCCECGAFAPYAQNHFRHAPQAAEWLCERHAPADLKRPGDFLNL